MSSVRSRPTSSATGSCLSRSIRKVFDDHQLASQVSESPNTYRLVERGRRQATLSKRGECWVLSARCQSSRAAANRLSLWQHALQANSVLPPAASLGVLPGTLQLWLQVGIPASPYGPEEEVIGQVLRDWRAVRDSGVIIPGTQGRRGWKITSPARWRHAVPSPVDGDDLESTNGVLEDLLREDRWRFVHHEHGPTCVQLHLSEQAVYARVEPLENGDVRLVVDLPADDAAGETVPAASSEMARTLLLLRSTAGTHLARAAVAAGNNGSGSAADGTATAHTQWEALCRSPVSARDLSDHLTALTAAIRISWREYSALQDGGLARRYLGLRGWSP